MQRHEKLYQQVRQIEMRKKIVETSWRGNVVEKNCQFYGYRSSSVIRFLEMLPDKKCVCFIKVLSGYLKIHIATAMTFTLEVK